MPIERVHIYRMPEKLDDGYCFGSGKLIMFLNVDWFDIDPDHRAEVILFIRKKRYFVPGKKYLMLGQTFAEVIQ